MFLEDNPRSDKKQKISYDELQKIDTKIAAEKKGTAAYQQALNERTKLGQDYNLKVADLDVERYNNQVKLEEIGIEQAKVLLEQKKATKYLSNEDYYQKLTEFEDRKHQLAYDGLKQQERLYQNDEQKLEEINQQKLELEANYQLEKTKINSEFVQANLKEWKDFGDSIGSAFKGGLTEILKGNQTIKDSFLNIFGEIEGAFASLIANMIAKKAMRGLASDLGFLSGMGGFIGTAATFLRGLFFADGGIVPGNYNQAIPATVHGSEMILNPLQQANLWNLIASSNNNGGQHKQANQQTSSNQPMLINNITPVFQSLDPNQGQKLFQGWMKQSGIPIVRDSIKNNNLQMRDIIKGVS